MALSARFGADFSQLVDALGDVEVKIKSVADRASASAPQFARLVNEFNGTKIEQQAAIMVAAITKVGEKEGLLGGIARLTAAEQAKVNVLVTEAIAKYNAMGKLAPVDLRLLEDATKKVVTETQKIQPAAASGTEAFGKMAGSLRDLAGAFGIGVSVGGIVSLVKELITAASAIDKLSKQTGIGVVEIQRLQYAADQSDTSLETMVSSVNQLQRRLAGDDASAAAAVRTLGLDLMDLESAKPDEALYRIASALEAIPSPAERTFLAVKLFGRGGAEALAPLLEKMREVADQAPVMTEATVAAMDAAERSYKSLMATVKTSLAEALFGDAQDTTGRFNEALLETNQAAKEAIALRNQLAAMQVQAGRPTPNINPPIGPLTSYGLMVADYNRAGGEGALAAETEALKTYREELDRITITGGLPTLNRLVREGTLDASALADAFGVSTTTVSRFAEELKKGQEATEKFAAAQDAMSGQKLIADANELVATYGRLAAQGLKPTYAELVKVNAIMAEATAAAQLNGRTIPAAWATVTLASKSLAGQMGAYAAAAQNAADQSDAINEAVSVLPSRALATGQAFDEATEAMRRMANLMPEVKDQTDDIKEALDKLAKEHAKKVKEALGNVCDAIDGFSRVAEMAGHRTTAALASVASTTIKAFGTGSPVAGSIALVTGLFTALGDKIFKTAQKALNDTRDLFITSQGGFAALHAAAVKAGAESSFLALLQAKNTKTYEAALTKLNTILQKTSELEAARIAAVPVWETVSALAEKYGISVESAGQAVQQLMINANAKTMINDWQTWAKAGGNMDAMATGMAKSMSTLVQQSLAYGTTLPENLRPVLDFLSGAGILVDAAGNKIDVGALSFGPEVQTEMERMTKAIEDLVVELRALNGLPPMGASLSSLVAAQTSRFASTDRAVQYAGAQASGGDYWVTKPTLFLAGEAGPERATFRPGGTGSQTTSIVEGAVTVNFTIHAVNADGVRDLVERELLPKVVDAVRGNRRQARTDLRAALGVR